MTILVTGAAGFIGAYACRALKDRGDAVVGIDSFNDYYDPQLKRDRVAALCADIDIRQIDLADRGALEALFEEVQPSRVVHLGAQAGVRYSLSNPHAYVDSNLVGFVNMLELCRHRGVQHLAYASSSSVYGDSAKPPFSEDQRVDQPRSLYAATKAANELMAHTYAHLYGLRATGLRFFTVYGPWGRPDMALFKFVKAMLDDREIEIYGEGRMSRDFTYIDDLVDSIIDLSKVPPSEANRVANVDTLSAEGPFRTVNLGGGQPVGLLDFIEVIAKAMGKPAKRKMLPMQKGDVPRTFASPELLLALTGRKPETGLEEGVGAFVRWYLDHRSEID